MKISDILYARQNIRYFHLFCLAYKISGGIFTLVKIHVIFSAAYSIQRHNNTFEIGYEKIVKWLLSSNLAKPKYNFLGTNSTDSRNKRQSKQTLMTSATLQKQVDFWYGYCLQG